MERAYNWRWSRSWKSRSCKHAATGNENLAELWNLDNVSLKMIRRGNKKNG